MTELLPSDYGKDGKPIRTCYNCKNGIRNIEGKYYCNEKCWNEWKEKNPMIQKRHVLTKEKLEAMKTWKPKRDVVADANRIFAVDKPL